MTNKTVLVCGGAGYIGSHAVAVLLEKGCNVVVADNLEKGHKQAVTNGAKLIVGDLRDEPFTMKLFKENKVDAVIDFAAYSLVGESVGNPLKYYENNLYGTMNLLNAMVQNEVHHIVFSSTAATYGIPKSIPILETAETNPINPYGETKLAVEKMLKWANNAHSINYAVLRYFNVAGAHISGNIGEDHRPETHLIPNILRAALNNEAVTMFGNDYNTPDGTCIRDYIHIIDLVDAHILALEKIMESEDSITYNLGSGKGFSNLEIIEAARKVTGIDIECLVADRRPGDPDILVASSDKIICELGWTPKNGNLEAILESAWRWHSKHPKGYME